jgi:hypothetical protein
MTVEAHRDRRAGPLDPDVWRVGNPSRDPQALLSRHTWTGSGDAD